MPSVAIGKVIEVSNTIISIAIHKEIEAPYLLLDGSPIRIGGVGSFVRVGNAIYEIVSERIILESGTKDESVKVASNRIVNCHTVGFFEGEKYKQGSSGKTPNIFDTVYTVMNEELTKIYTGTTAEQSIMIGKYLYEQDLFFYVDINKFFASHTLIVGNTGSGKSNTLNTIYTNLFSNIEIKKSYFLFIDTNGEYSSAFTDEKEIKSLNTHDTQLNTLHIPMQLLEIEDWKLLLEATEKTQYPIIKAAWNNIIKNVFTEKKPIQAFIIDELKKTVSGILNSNASASNKLGAINSIKEDISYMSDVFYQNIYPMFDDCNQVAVNNNRLVYRDGNVYEDIVIKIIESINKYKVEVQKDEFTIEDFGLILNMIHLYRTYRYNTNENNTSPLIARFNTNKREFSKIFLPYKKGQSVDIIETLFADKQILICNVSRAKKDVRRIIVTFLCSKLYNYYCSTKKQNTSLHLIVDEAHNYLSSQNIDKEDAIAKTCIETFEGIIKEGRKFGVFLTMATQRPSDITSTLLSQSHNYVIHKLVNPKDIEIIKNTVPFIDDMSMKMLSVLAPGQAIFSGTAFNRPNIVEVILEEKVTKVESDTVKLMNTWKRKKANVLQLKQTQEQCQADKKIWEKVKDKKIILANMVCMECFEEALCCDEEYGPIGFCLNCGTQN